MEKVTFIFGGAIMGYDSVAGYMIGSKGFMLKTKRPAILADPFVLTFRQRSIE